LANPVKGTGSQGFFESFLNNPLNLILLMFVALYLVLLLLPKPGRKEQKALEERLANLKKNDRVVLSSGIHGIVANINAEAGTITLRVDEGSNAKLTVDRSAIRSVEA
jgi:preprotein translocase YajC subunit